MPDVVYELPKSMIPIIIGCVAMPAVVFAKVFPPKVAQVRFFRRPFKVLHNHGPNCSREAYASMSSTLAHYQDGACGTVLCGHLLKVPDDILDPSLDPIKVHAALNSSHSGRMKTLVRSQVLIMRRIVQYHCIDQEGAAGRGPRLASKSRTLFQMSEQQLLKTWFFPIG